MLSRIQTRHSAVVAGATAALLAPLFALSGATAAPAATEVVTEADVTRQVENTPPTDNWVLYTRAGTPPTAGAFVDGPVPAPLGAGSLQLTTATADEKVFLFNYDHVGTRLADIDDIAYSTYRTAGSADQLAALNLQVDFNGAAAGGFTTLAFEPVYNTDQSGVVENTWQNWDAINEGGATWWSTRTIPGVCAFDCFVSWADILAANPDATILGGVGVNQGSGNGGLTSNVDAFTFDDVTYDFERVRDTDGDGVPDEDDTNTKDDCKDGGWERFTSPEFKNQGDCVSHFASNK